MAITSNTNIFTALAETLIARGEDMELIASELAIAFAGVVTDGKGEEFILSEFTRMYKIERS